MIRKRILVAFSIVFFNSASWVLLADEKPIILGNAEDGKNKAALCSGCHGLNGEGKVMPDGQPAIPLLAGQIPGYFVKSMYEYKADKRIDPLMNAITKGLTDVDIANLAAFYVTLRLK
ncbi:MAG: cytochrome c [Pseudomonadota bacterium]